MLQGLAAKGILSTALLDDTNERSKACRATRQHLILHEDYRLRPLVRDHLASVVLDDDVNHNNAFLEHDVHSEALVLLFGIFSVYIYHRSERIQGGCLHSI